MDDNSWTKELNVRGWNERVAAGDPWIVPVDDQTIRRARSGDWSVLLTPQKAVPRHWFGDLLAVGFVLTGFYEDVQDGRVCSRYFPAAFASRAEKPKWR